MGISLLLNVKDMNFLLCNPLCFLKHQQGAKVLPGSSTRIRYHAATVSQQYEMFRSISWRRSLSEFIVVFGGLRDAGHVFVKTTQSSCEIYEEWCCKK